MSDTLPNIYHLNVDVGLAKKRVGGWIVPRKLHPDDTHNTVFEHIPSIHGPGPMAQTQLNRLALFDVELAMTNRQALLAPIASLSAAPFGIFDVTLAELVERLDPGRHQIVPLRNVRIENGKKAATRDYALVHVHDEILTVDASQSEISVTPLPHLGNVFSFGLNSLVPETRVVFAAAAQKKHLWRCSLTRSVFCDDVFKSEVEALDLSSGIDFRPCTVITGDERFSVEN